MTRLVTLHGFLGSPATWHPVRGARPHVGLTLPYHGLPPVHAECTGWDHALELLERDLPTGPLVLLGYSLGSRLALGLCARLGARVVAAVLVSGHAGIADDNERRARTDFDATMARELTQSPTMAPFVDRWEQLPLFATQAAADPERLRAQRLVREAHDPRVVAGAFRALGTSLMPDYEAVLPQLETPILFVAGEHDAKYRTLAARYASKTPRGAYVMQPGVGHNPLLEAPAALAHTVDAFLESHS